MVVQHNMQAVNANRMLNVTVQNQGKSTEKLSSGYRINRAADDAAGLSISEKMRKQIRGLDRASTNAQDGVSAVQTAEGALNEVHDMLQRMNELAVQAANGTNSETDRTAIQNEIDQLTTEIDRVSETTKFNETYLLKGDRNATRQVSYSFNANPVNDVATATAKFYTDGATGMAINNNDVTGTGIKFSDTAKQDDQNAIAKALRDQGVSVTYNSTYADPTGTALTGTVTNGYTLTLNGDAAQKYDVVTVNGMNKNDDGTDANTATFKIQDHNGNTIATITVGGANMTDASQTEKSKTQSSILTAENVTAAKGFGEISQYFDKDGNKISANSLNNYFAISDGTVNEAQGGGTKLKVGSGFSTANATTANITQAQKNLNIYATKGMGGASTPQGATSTTAGAAITQAGSGTDANKYADAQLKYDAGQWKVSDADGTTGTAVAIGNTFGIKLPAGAVAADGDMIKITHGDAELSTDELATNATAGSPTAGKTSTALLDKVGITNQDKLNKKLDQDITFQYNSTDETWKAYNSSGTQIGTDPVSLGDYGITLDPGYQLKNGDQFTLKKDAIATFEPKEKTIMARADSPMVYDAVGNQTTLNTATVSAKRDIAGDLTLKLHVGADATTNNQISINIASMSAKGLGVNGMKIDGADDTNAKDAIETIKQALQKVSDQRSALGAAQNRLEHTINNLDNVVENTESAESRIRDTDMAEEMVTYSKNNILAQAGQSMLAQANQSNQGVLSLIG